MAQFNFDLFFKGYVTAALWSSNDEEGNPLDDQYNEDDIHPAALAQMRDYCKDFMDSNLQDLLAYKARMGTEQDKGEERAGHDFWLTRNGHGAGFWDRGLQSLGDRLTKACKPYGGCHLYVGDDGLIHV